MPSALRTFRKTQIGKEATAGIAVAASRRLLMETVNPTLVEELRTFESDADGTLAHASRTPVPIRQGLGVSFSGDFDFAQVLLPLLSGYRGGVGPQLTGTNVRTWTFTPAISGVASIDTYTIEIFDSDGADEETFEGAGGFTTAMNLSGSRENLVKMGWEMMAGPPQGVSGTPNLALPDSWYYAPSVKVLIRVATTWAGLATATPLKVVNYGWQWSLADAFAAGYYTGQDDLGFSARNPGSRNITLRLDVESGVGANDLVPLQRAIKKGGQRTFVEIELVGDAIESNVAHSLKVRGSYTHAPESMSGDQDNNGRVATTMQLRSNYDPVSGRDTQIVLVNGIASFP